MTLVGWVVLAVIVGSALFVVRGIYLLRRQIAALVRGATAWVRARPLVSGVALTLVALLVVVGLAWKVPIWQLASRAASLAPDRYLELQNSYRTTIVQALGGIVLLFGIYVTWRRVAATEQQVVIAGEGQITERFARAIELLGSEKLAVRLGGIYALERIARDSERDHWPIMEVLTAYVRENAPRPEEAEDAEEQYPTPVATDIQAILTVIGRRRVEFERAGERILDLRRTNLSLASLLNAKLSGANLLFAHLFGADLSGADLSDANLCGVNLSEADLSEADLSGAHLLGADLRGANLSGVDLFGADLSGANLSGANLWGADLSGANLKGVNLSATIGLTREQMESAITDETTIWPDHLKEGGEESAEEAGGEAS